MVATLRRSALMDFTHPHVRDIKRRLNVAHQRYYLRTLVIQDPQEIIRFHNSVIGPLMVAFADEWERRLTTDQFGD